MQARRLRYSPRRKLQVERERLIRWLRMMGILGKIQRRGNWEGRMRDCSIFVGKLDLETCVMQCLKIPFLLRCRSEKFEQKKTADYTNWVSNSALLFC